MISPSILAPITVEIGLNHPDWIAGGLGGQWRYQMAVLAQPVSNKNVFKAIFRTSSVQTYAAASLPGAISVHHCRGHVSPSVCLAMRCSHGRELCGSWRGTDRTVRYNAQFLQANSTKHQAAHQVFWPLDSILRLSSIWPLPTCAEPLVSSSPRKVWDLSLVLRFMFLVCMCYPSWNVSDSTGREWVKICTQRAGSEQVQICFYLMPKIKKDN